MATTPGLGCILEVRIAYCDGFNRQEQLDLIRAVEAHRDKIERAWNVHFR
jgi:hypothetical protein